jgi:Ca-activated chloride channel family protein
MKFRYTKYTGDLLDEIDLDNLVSKLSDLLLSSGFNNPWGHPLDDEEDRTMQALHDAILEALFSGGMLSDEAMQKLLGEPADGDQERARQQIEDLIQQIIERMMEQGFITGAPDLDKEREHRRGTGGGVGEDAGPVTFEVTDKALDFLGYRALRDLLGSIGRSDTGRHDTHHLSTGVETAAAPKPYEFGDTLNIDPSSTILNAVRRLHAQGKGIGDRGSDTSNPSRIADPGSIRTQYPGDSLRAVLFHDSAEEIPLKQLGRVRVGPYYTNTREGLRLARRILERQKKDMRQIVMITDGKPSALTRPDGQIYKNAFGLDPFIVSETFAEVNACQKAGIMINTFMLARDHDLVAFVRRVAAICRGKAYFTTPYTLGQYVLMDYMDRKTKTIH